MSPVSRDGDDEGRDQPPSKPFSVSLSKGNGPSSKKTINLQSSNRSRPTDSPGSSSRSLPRRPHHLDHGDDSDEGDSAPVHEEVSGFDTHTGSMLTADGQAVSDGTKPLVIPVASKTNWRDRPGVNVKKGRKNLLPREVQAIQAAERNGQAIAGGKMETDAPSMAYGLSFAQKPTDQKTNGAAGEDEAMLDAKPLLPPPVDDQKPLTDDQIAMQALLRESQGDVERRTDLTIESSKPGQAQDEDEEPVHYDEISSFRTDVASRPDSATLDAYNAIPVEEFGAALLRGMGWKDGQPIGRAQYGTSATADRDRANKPRIPERRPGFLGIGAKDTSGGKGAEVELGAWGKSAMRKASRKQENGKDSNTEGVYMPVMVRNKNTGEYMTEEELGALQKEAKSKSAKEDDWRERRDRNLEKSWRDKDREYRRRDYDDDDRYDRRNGSTWRERSLSSGRHPSRHGRYDDDDDKSSRSDRSHRDRDRERRRERDDRDRRKDRDREYEKDRERDRSHRYRDGRYGSSRHSTHSSRHDRESHRRRDD